MVVFETIDFMKTKLKDSSAYKILKLDINMVYDGVEWCYMRHVMEHLGFHEIWLVFKKNP